MCGILLIFSKNETSLNKKKCLEAFKTLDKRGPDKKLYNFFLNDRIFLGNTILSITGNLKEGRTLYNSSNSQNYTSYNGEIYNFKKLAKKYKININTYKNDTEFLTNFLGKKKNFEFLNEFEGMFSFINFNLKRNEIYFATDPQGEKRLYYFNDKKHLIISSTPKPILKFINKKFKLNNELFSKYFNTRHFMLDDKWINREVNIADPGKLNIFNIRNNKLKSKFFDNPINWISKKKYFEYKKLGLSKSKTLLKNIIKNTLNNMKPDINFGSTFSGGVDSSLVCYYLNNDTKFKKSISVNNLKKDHVVENIKNFKKYINLKKHQEIKLNLNSYYKNLKKTYKYIGMPLLSHDNVGRMKIFSFFKEANIKVIFNGDGADELFGGYTIYENLNWQNYKSNNSPYSSVSLNKNKYNFIWKKAYKKYCSFLKKKEASIQASLFSDYFVQCVGVHNIANDLLSGENSIEVRSLFLNKNIINFAINLPLSFKLLSKNNLKSKIILKKIFIELFTKRLLLKKIGFSGFPNETRSLLKSKELKELSKFMKLAKNREISKALEWKFLNIIYFNKYLKENYRLNFKI